VYIIYYK